MSVMIYILSEIVRDCAYRVGMTCSNVFLHYYVSTLIFHPCLNFESFQKLDVRLKDLAESMHTASDVCEYDTYSNG